jgi:hypothetical protein
MNVRALMPGTVVTTIALLVVAGLIPPASALADAAIPYKSAEPDVGGLFTRILLSLGLLCAAGALAAVFLRKRLVQSGMVPEKSGARLRVGDRRVLSRKTVAHLLEVDGRDVLVVESERQQPVRQRHR